MSSALRKLIPPIAVVLLSTAQAWAGWQVLPFTFTETLYKIRFANSDTGWVIGDKHLYKTTDGGTTWSVQDTSWSYSEALCVLNGKIVFYADYNLKKRWTSQGIRKSTDGGLTWATVDTNQFLYTDFEFPTQSVGYASAWTRNGTFVCKTTDGGDHWILLPFAFKPSKNEIQGLSFIGEKNGWAVTWDGYIFGTQDGGDSWTLQDSVKDASNNFVAMHDIQFVTLDSGWVAGGLTGQMVIGRTTNGGDHWDLPVTAGTSAQELCFLNSRLGWIVGTSNGPNYFLANTEDGGISWKSQTSQVANLLGVRSISMIDETTGYAIAMISSPSNFKVLKMSDPAAVDAAAKALPADLALEQNYPNPFNGETVIAFSLPGPQFVRLEIFNIRGERTTTLLAEQRSKGRHEIKIDAARWPAGLYWYRLQARDAQITKKFLLLR